MTAASCEFATAGRIMAVPGLAAFGLTAGQAGDIAAQALTSSSIQGNPVPLSREELEAIVGQAL